MAASPPSSPLILLPSISAIELASFAAVLTAIAYSAVVYRYYYVFAWNCFLKPFLKSGARKHRLNSLERHQDRLEDFYKDQASVYDATRRRLLRGRTTMLNLCAVQLRHYYTNQSAGRLAWLDIGGGTGENIERMNQFFPVKNFHRVYLVDITPSLCEIARRRFHKLGWTNVTVLCMDADRFEAPKEDGDVEIALITLSYSLSMMESFYGVVDRLTSLLSPTGIIGVADFYISGKRSVDPTRQLSWLTRWFWSIWFDLDNIYLHPSRREYLEHKFATIKSLSAKNPFVKPFVKIPYYVWIGASKRSDAVLLGQGMRWRQEFDLSLISRFSTYIYAFAWEDPRVDLQFLDLNRSDRMLVITSGGCNCLEYAIHGPARIHAVDLNPCQNNLLELKLAAISALDHSMVWSLFGEGYVANFSALLDTHLSPYLSPYAYRFWKQNAGFKHLYKTGCSGLAIRVFQFVTKVWGLRSAVERMCSAGSVKEQCEIWRKEIRPHFLSKWLVKILNNDRFLWGALGVPPAQIQMVLGEQSVYDFMASSLDPILANSSLRDDNYFYYMPLMLRYTPANCPGYLSEQGFKTLKENPRNLDAIRIHTDTIVNVLNKQCYDGELTKVILMDHLDWFSHEDADAEISAVARKIKLGGRAYWRSAGKRPWYNEIFEKRGFRVFPLQIREGEAMYLDRVNTYPSFWCGERI